MSQNFAICRKKSQNPCARRKKSRNRIGNPKQPQTTMGARDFSISPHLSLLSHPFQPSNRSESVMVPWIGALLSSPPSRHIPSLSSLNVAVARHSPVFTLHRCIHHLRLRLRFQQMTTPRLKTISRLALIFQVELNEAHRLLQLLL